MDLPENHPSWMSRQADFARRTAPALQRLAELRTRLRVAAHQEDEWHRFARSVNAEIGHGVDGISTATPSVAASADDARVGCDPVERSLSARDALLHAERELYLSLSIEQKILAGEQLLTFHLQLGL